MPAHRHPILTPTAPLWRGRPARTPGALDVRLTLDDPLPGLVLLVVALLVLVLLP